MKITICGSVTFLEKNLEVKKQLEEVWHQVQYPTSLDEEMLAKIGDDKMDEVLKNSELHESSYVAKVTQVKRQLIEEHFEKIKRADAVLIVNEEKHGISWYIGVSVMMEIAAAKILWKKIYVLNEIGAMGYKSDVLGCMPIVIGGNLESIK